ncbi:ribosomal RNA methyltransferase, putative [Entamoeba dispar SAW760]|uniref:Ribosomal RNA methyltransferase, putative n=1 Tax=Entamoeba dispar (strain ATCC PRA-260 / SAW760) TaxID=370354 RepID=B0E9B0_ENTDS|nr:ribosomal RNA methyltransferase, putative [Entamoeba dispar SAW760]EDR28886.1 ribosomal RNA methyltransferase, putative [Entamoeba dispar SAW760]|eukprot:EDR28886.1 ribosomal RNA methyltransferase, putative [Entamoeba dispar SAW760]
MKTTIDKFHRQAKQEGYRARSAFKLIDVERDFHIFDGVHNVVDLCAAPGSWSQVLSKTIKEPKNIVSVDLQDIAPIEGVKLVKGDITKGSTAKEVMSHFTDGKADLIICDGAPDVTGIHDIDEANQWILMQAAFSIMAVVLKQGGSFVAKIFVENEYPHLYFQFKSVFESVTIYKPESSRSSSYEHFVVCKGFNEANTCLLEEVPDNLEELPLTKRVMTREIESVPIQLEL